MCIFTMSIHSIYLASDLEDSDNGDPYKCKITGTEL
jgi:hypothetical protein